MARAGRAPLLRLCRSRDITRYPGEPLSGRGGSGDEVRVDVRALIDGYRSLPTGEADRRNPLCG